MDLSKDISKFQKMAIYFFIYAFLGWIGEEIFCVVSTHEFVNRGFLFGPICPIYGYGAIILILCFKDYKKKPVKLFFLAAIIFSVFEYITDFFLQALFGARWWDYTGFFLNINSRITLSFSILWGFGSLIFIKFLHPLCVKAIDKLMSKIPFKAQHIIIDLLLSLMVIDTAVSSIKYLNIF